MGRAGGSYEMQKNGKKKLLEQTREADADPVTTRLEKKEVTDKAAKSATTTKEA